jgi:hypothetical protein
VEEGERMSVVSSTRRASKFLNSFLQPKETTTERPIYTTSQKKDTVVVPEIPSEFGSESETSKGKKEH